MVTPIRRRHAVVLQPGLSVQSCRSLAAGGRQEWSHCRIIAARCGSGLLIETFKALVDLDAVSATPNPPLSLPAHRPREKAWEKIDQLIVAARAWRARHCESSARDTCCKEFDATLKKIEEQTRSSPLAEAKASLQHHRSLEGADSEAAAGRQGAAGLCAGENTPMGNHARRASNT